MISLLTTGPVLVIGTGLLGASIGLGLHPRGVPVLLRDTSPAALALSRDMGAGEPWTNGSPEPALVVVAAPPDVTGACISSALKEFPQAVVTDVASVKSAVYTDVVADVPATLLSRYVGSHPMAGREKSGAMSARADLFAGRPWVIVPHSSSDESALIAVQKLATDLGALPTEFAADEHDVAVAAVSHVPQLLSSLMAAQLTDVSPSALALAGQGLRDVTRIASSDPRLWTAILAGNAGPIADILAATNKDLEDLIAALRKGDGSAVLPPGVVGPIASLMARGNIGVERIPGKHGGAPMRYGTLTVLVPDKPGELGRLFSEVGEIQVNIEDLQLEHSSGQKVGLATLFVSPDMVQVLADSLQKRGWRIVQN